MTVKTRVPATSANMGPGFDCIGMALGLHNRLTVTDETESGLPLEIVVKNKSDIPIPIDASNLIYKTMADFYREMGETPPPLRLVQEDDIPLARGLGSSAACIVSGLLAANALSGKNLTRAELLRAAAAIEGHPDNVAPAFLGGVVVGVMDEGESGRAELTYKKLDTPGLERLRFAAMIPAFPLETSKARQALPKTIPLADGVFNAPRAALLVAALASGDHGLLKTAVKDRFHQPYREPLVPGMAGIFSECEREGALAVFLSGAGPVIIAITERVRGFAPRLPGGWELRFLEPDLEGATAEIIS